MKLIFAIAIYITFGVQFYVGIQVTWQPIELWLATLEYRHSGESLQRFLLWCRAYGEFVLRFLFLCFTCELLLCQVYIMETPSGPVQTVNAALWHDLG